MFFLRKTIITILVALVVLILLSAGLFFVFGSQETKDLSKVLDKDIIYMLNKNPDAKDYMQKHPDFKIEKKEVLTNESIVAGQNGQNFKEVYQGLTLEENRYMKVDLINIEGDNGLIVVLDLKSGKVEKVFGKVLLKAGVQTK